jgi:hypothetical protein
MSQENAEVVRAVCKSGALLVGLALVLSACGDSAGDASKTTPRASKADVHEFLLRANEEPGFRPDGVDALTEVGVDSYAPYARLSRAEVQQLRENGFISFTEQRTIGRDAGGVSNVQLFTTPEGARNEMTYELRASTIRAILPETKIRRFMLRGVPGARGWTGRDLHGNPIGSAYWVQGRCMLVLVSEGDVSFVEALSTGARAIYQRTKGQCP